MRCTGAYHNLQVCSDRIYSLLTWSIFQLVLQLRLYQCLLMAIFSTALPSGPSSYKLYQARFLAASTCRELDEPCTNSFTLLSRMCDPQQRFQRPS